jgi:hypothetical protein
MTVEFEGESFEFGAHPTAQRIETAANRTKRIAHFALWTLDTQQMNRRKSESSHRKDGRAKSVQHTVRVETEVHHRDKFGAKSRSRLALAN